MYQLICKRLGVEPRTCLYVADGENYELAAAAQAGLHPVLIRNPTSRKRPNLFREATEWQGCAIAELSEVLGIVDAGIEQASSIPTIRRAVADDVPAISSCVAAAYERYVDRIGKPPAPMLDDYNQIVDQYDVFVLTVDEKVVGALVLVKQERSLLLDNIAVHPDYQGRGYGRKLVAFAEQRVKSTGLALLTLYPNEHMTESIELYKKLGFVEIERKTEQGYRRVYMQKTL
jgi:ribosomal protein S18 acetylase RimI-like enzyme